MMAKTLFPQFKDNISMALTPMVITARMVKKDHPNARIVFIGPCAAKKLEANRKSVRSDVDFVLTFEELLGMFDAKEIDFKTLEADPADGMDEGSGFGRGFAVGGGVAAAVVEAIKHIDPDREILIEYGDGLKECRKMLAMAKAGKRNGYLLEGMGCPGGCVAGAGTLRPVKESTASVERFKNAASSMSTTESPYLDRLKDVEENAESDPATADRPVVYHYLSGLGHCKGRYFEIRGQSCTVHAVAVCHHPLRDPERFSDRAHNGYRTHDGAFASICTDDERAESRAGKTVGKAVLPKYSETASVMYSNCTNMVVPLVIGIFE